MKIYSMHAFQNICFREVTKYYDDHKDKTDMVNADNFDVYMVWGVKELQNFKGLFSTTIPDGMYYELTYNGETEELYLDAYKKWENIVIK